MQSNQSTLCELRPHDRRETAADRRLRKFLTAVSAFDCELSESKLRTALALLAVPPETRARAGRSVAKERHSGVGDAPQL